MIRAFLLGAFGLAISNYAYYLAIQKTTVATAIILQYTAPIWVLLFLVLTGQQKRPPRACGALYWRCVDVFLRSAYSAGVAHFHFSALATGSIKLNTIGVAGSAGSSALIRFLQHLWTSTPAEV